MTELSHPKEKSTPVIELSSSIDDQVQKHIAYHPEEGWEISTTKKEQGTAASLTAKRERYESKESEAKAAPPTRGEDGSTTTQNKGKTAPFEGGWRALPILSSFWVVLFVMGEIQEHRDVLTSEFTWGKNFMMNSQDWRDGSRSRSRLKGKYVTRS